MFKKSFILFTCMGWWQHGQKTRDKLLFWFSLQIGYGVPKKFYSFHLDGCTTCSKKNLEFLFFLSNFMNFFHKFIVTFFLACHFVLLCSPISSFFFVLWRDENLHAQGKQNLSFAWRFMKKLHFFQLHECQLVGYVNNFYVRSVSMCQE